MKKVEVTTSINNSPANIIGAFMDPDMLREWWGVERSLIEKRPNGLYTLAWNIGEQGFGYVSSGIIKEYRPESSLIIENFVYMNPERPFLGPMALTIEAKDKGGKTELYLCQDGYREGEDWDWYYNAVKQAWPAVVQNLKDFLEKRKI